EDRGETIALNEALGAPRPDVWGEIVNGVAATPRRPPWSQRLAAWFGIGAEARAPRLLALVAGLVIAAQAATIVTLLRHEANLHERRRSCRGARRFRARGENRRDFRIAGGAGGEHCRWPEPRRPL